MYFDHIYPLLKLNKCSNEYNKGHGSMMKEGVLSVPKKDWVCYSFIPNPLCKLSLTELCLNKLAFVNSIV